MLPAGKKRKKVDLVGINDFVASMNGMILAIDPGEVHVGIAWFRRKETGEGWECLMAGEVRPFQVLLTLETDNEVQKVILEEFRLYPWKMKEQGFSQLKTVELIGAIKYVCNRRAIELEEQPASIKRPTEGILKGKGIALKSSGRGGHAKDAELHGYYYFRSFLKGE